MKEVAKLGPVSPFFIVERLERSIAFYRDALGFDLQLLVPEDDPFFAIVGRDGVRVFLKHVGPDVPPQPNPSRHPWARWDAFVHVEDPDALAAELADRGTAFREELADTDDGLRGFEIEDGDGYVLFFGRPR